MRFFLRLRISAQGASCSRSASRQNEMRADKSVLVDRANDRQCMHIQNHRRPFPSIGDLCPETWKDARSVPELTRPSSLDCYCKR